MFIRIQKLTITRMYIGIRLKFNERKNNTHKETFNTFQNMKKEIIEIHWILKNIYILGSLIIENCRKQY